MGQGGTPAAAVVHAPRPLRARPAIAVVGLVADAVVVVVVSLLLWTVLPSIGLQATPRVIADDLMAPLVRTGDVLLTVRPKDPVHGLIAPGAIVVSDPTLTARRIVRTGLDGYEVRGDAQGLEEPETVTPETIVGVGRFLVPWIGLPAHWVRTQRWDALVVGTVVLVGAVVMSGAASTGRARRRATTVPSIELPRRVPGAHHPVVLAAQRRDAIEATRRAAAASRAAERGARTLPTLEQRRAAEREAERHARRDRRGSAGSVAGGLLVLAVVIVAAGTSQPAFATMQAEFVDAGSRFSVAVDEPDGPEEGELLTVFQLPAYDGAPSYAADQQDGTITFAIPVTATQRLTGPVSADLLLAPSTPGNPERTVEVALLLDGAVIATSSQALRTTDPEPTMRTSTLSPPLDGVDIGPGDRLEVRITLRRMELFLDPGPSALLFP